MRRWTEAGQTFYGHSFIADQQGELVESLGAEEEGVLVHGFDLDELDKYRAAVGLLPGSADGSVWGVDGQGLRESAHPRESGDPVLLRSRALDRC